MPSGTGFDSLLTSLLADGADASQLPGDAEVILLSADTDRTQAYVFESNRLPEIRGASRLLAGLNRGDHWVAQQVERDREYFEYYAVSAVHRALAAAGLSDDCLLFADGGSVVALLPPDEQTAGSLAEALKREYLRATGIATISVVWRRFSVSQLMAGYTQPARGRVSPEQHSRLEAYSEQHQRHFGEIMLLMASLLRAEKQHRPKPFFERMPFARVCHSCQSRPAIGFDFPGEPDAAPICWPCTTKLVWGGSPGRTYWLQELSGLLRDAGYDYPDARFPQDLEQLSAGGEIALVYADGDSIGDKLHKLARVSDYRRFSQALGRVTARAVAEAIAASGLRPHEVDDPKRGASTVHPWEVITIGGDDVMAFVPASSAMAFVRALASGFKELAASDPDLSLLPEVQPLTMSVGFAIGKTNIPVRRLYDAARAALKQAKRRAREVGQPCVDYHNFVTEGLPGLSLNNWRLDTRRIGPKAGPRALTTARPFTLSELEWLQQSVLRLREVQFARSQLHLLSDSLSRSLEQSLLLYYYQRARLPDAKRDALVDVQAIWGGEEELWPWFFVDHPDYRYATPFQDIVESYDLFTTHP